MAIDRQAKMRREETEKEKEKKKKRRKEEVPHREQAKTAKRRGVQMLRLGMGRSGKDRKGWASLLRKIFSFLPSFFFLSFIPKDVHSHLSGGGEKKGTPLTVILGGSGTGAGGGRGWKTTFGWLGAGGAWFIGTSVLIRVNPGIARAPWRDRKAGSSFISGGTGRGGYSTLSSRKLGNR